VRSSPAGASVVARNCIRIEDRFVMAIIKHRVINYIGMAILLAICIIVAVIFCTLGLVLCLDAFLPRSHEVSLQAEIVEFVIGTVLLGVGWLFVKFGDRCILHKLKRRDKLD
jgi:uncharacterized membrane-anchored protein